VGRAVDGSGRSLNNFAGAKEGHVTHMLTGIVAQDCLHPLIRHESTIFDVMNEAQRFDILLKSTRYVLSIAPEAGPDKFMGDTP
jgi:hypothetical protein